MDTSKVIRGVVNSGKYTVTAPIVKEDYGLYLQIEGVELPPTYQVDFSNSEQNGTSVTMIGNSDGVLIPHQFIDTGKDIFAFLYHVGEDYGRTVYKFRIPNKVRPDRTDDTPTPEEQSVIDQAISALNTAVANTAQDVISADQSARSASGDADRAESAMDTAGEYANDAESSAASASTSASQASQSATASAQSASQSAQIKSDVEDLVDDAQGYAQASAQSATASANSATTAQGYANTASASAQSASTSASNASTSAQTASTKASEASTSEQTASTKASEASTSAQTASTKATESAQSASQALSYKTDAESAKTASQTAQGLAESARDTAVSAKTDAESAKDDAVQAKEDAESAVASISGALADKAPVITDTASGAIASFPDGADDLPLKSLVVDINPVQDLSHGDPSPENICPISGWTQVGVEQRGVNVWDEEWEKGYYDISDGSAKASSSWQRSKNDIVCKPNTVYCARQEAAASSLGYFLFYKEDGEYISSLSMTGIVPTTGQTFSTPSECRIIRIYRGINNNGLGFSINYPSTDHSYHPYTGRSITINLGQTVYGGKLDVLSGELVVDRANIASYNGETLPSTWISDRDVYASGTTPTTGAQVVYQLATPIEIQLTPNQVNSLLGVNNIWSDSGDTEAVYRADTKLFIERLTAPDLADMIADANITSGQYFMVGNSLYKATANIANGSAIVVGTNCIRKSLSEALNEINA